jgi:hypothetical protein
LNTLYLASHIQGLPPCAEADVDGLVNGTASNRCAPLARRAHSSDDRQRTPRQRGDLTNAGLLAARAIPAWRAACTLARAGSRPPPRPRPRAPLLSPDGRDVHAACSA